MISKQENDLPALPANIALSATTSHVMHCLQTIELYAAFTLGIGTLGVLGQVCCLRESP